MTAQTKIVTIALAISTTVGLSSTPVFAKEYYFYVTNSSSSRIDKLQVSENGKKWSYFDIGKGIRSGAKNVKLIWDESTNSEDCNQWIKAVFADGSSSTPSRFDFCTNLDDPIVFE